MHDDFTLSFVYIKLSKEPNIFIVLSFYWCFSVEIRSNLASCHRNIYRENSYNGSKKWQHKFYIRKSQIEHKKRDKIISTAAI